MVWETQIPPLRTHPRLTALAAFITLARHGHGMTATISSRNNTNGNWSAPASIPNAAGDVARYTHTGTAGAAGTTTPDQNTTFGSIDHREDADNNTTATGLTKSGQGNLTLTAPNTGTGATFIHAATLTIGNNPSTGSQDPTGGIVNHASLVLNRNDTPAQGVDFGPISGTGSVTKSSGGLLELSAANSSYICTLPTGAGKNLRPPLGRSELIGALPSGPLVRHLVDKDKLYPPAESTS